ncbi:MAG: hypothetical protein PUB05_01170 [Firmicutes bacterium]|nr:hypothetical protein [Bacillota bacterium]
MKNFAKIFSAVLCTAMILASCGGGGQPTSSGADSSDTPVSSVASETSSAAAPTSNSKLFSTDVWQAVPMVSKSMLNSGYTGGEGCQWPSCISYDPVEGKYAYMGTDVGGVFRSTDGGNNWEPSTIGLDTCGAVAVASDPNNIKRVVLIGSSNDRSGVFLSTDAGETWERVYKTYLSRAHDYREQIAFDESSNDKSLGGSKIVYWLRANEEANVISSKGIKVGLYKSTDGGKTWNHVSGTEKYASGWLAIDTKGNLFIATKSGIFKSADKGATFKQVFTTATNSLCTIRTSGYQNNVYAMTNDGLYVSTNNGNSFSKVTTKMPAGVSKNYTYLEVSPLNPKKMIMQNDTMSIGAGYSVPCYYSTDGGKTWNQSTTDTTTNVWAPYNVRQRMSSWNPKKENEILTFGGDLIYKSTDGGKTYKNSSQGYNGIFIGSNFSFNINNPKLVAIASQDYNGGFSTDGGKTWTYVNWSGAGWGGFTYGAYALTEKTVVTGVSNNWATSSDSVLTICVTFDGGKTVVRTGCVVEGAKVAIGAKGNNNIAFFGEWRTTDGAKTWVKMDGCVGVMYCDSKTGRLFGVNGEAGKYDIVVSNDNGASWKVIFKNAGYIDDICYNNKSNKVFYAGGASTIKYFKWTDGQAEPSYIWYDTGAGGTWGVCCDPTNNDIMYATMHTVDNYDRQNVIRSLDGGKTWTGLCREPGDGRTGPDGANQAMRCEVNPLTHELFVATHCNGMWKISGPPSEYLK